MGDTLYASGSFDWRGGSFGTEYLAYVLSAPGPLDQPVLVFADGTAKVYGLNPVQFFGSGTMAFAGGNASLFVAEPFGGFEDFAIFQETDVDPVQGFVVTRQAGNSAGVGDPWTRHYVVAVPPKKARFAVPHIQLGGTIPASTSQYLDGHQLEVLRTDQNAPTAFESARSIRVKVRPKRLNYATGSQEVARLIPGRTYTASAAVSGVRESHQFTPTAPTAHLDFSSSLFSENFARADIGSKPGPSNTHYDNTIGDVGDEASGGVVATTVYDGVIGEKCVNFTNPAVLANTFGFLGKRVTPSNGVMVLERLYKLDAHPSFRTSVLLYKDALLAGTHIGSFAFGGSASAFKFVLVNVDTNSTTSTNVVPLNEWFRVRLTLDTVNHTQKAELFLGANVFGANPTEVISASMGTAPLGYLEDGILTNPNVTINVTMAHPRNMSRPPTQILVEEGTTAGEYFDGDSGDDFLWEQGGTPGLTRSYYYPDRAARHYVLVRTLQENVALGMTVGDPVYATFPSPSSTS